MHSRKMEVLRVKKAQIEAELSKLQARTRAENRKADTRRKILIGAVIMQEMEARNDFDAWVNKLLGERLTKEKDRELFGLPSMPPTKEADK